MSNRDYTSRCACCRGRAQGHYDGPTLLVRTVGDHEYPGQRGKDDLGWGGFASDLHVETVESLHACMVNRGAVVAVVDTRRWWSRTSRAETANGRRDARTGLPVRRCLQPQRRARPCWGRAAITYLMTCRGLTGLANHEELQSCLR